MVRYYYWNSRVARLGERIKEEIVIKKILKITSVAKFKNFTSEGDIQLRRLNLVHGNNGKGKSTIASILRSLSKGDSKFIEAKLNQSSSLDQEVEILLDDNTNAIFKNNTWNKTVDNIIIFDDHYVTENIYSGDHVSAKNKQNLFYLVVGEDSVNKAQKITDLDEEINELNPTIKNKKEVINQNNKGSISIEAYLALTKVEDIDEKINKEGQEIKSIEDEHKIKSASSFEKLDLPKLDFASFEVLLNKSVGNIKKNAIEKYESHTEGIEDDWIKNGLTVVNEDECPFCKQSLTGLEIIEIYQHFFNEELLRLKKEVDEHLLDFEQVYSEDKSHTVQKLLGDNIITIEFWKKYINDIEVEDIRDEVKILRDQIMVLVDEHLKAKANDLLSPLLISDELKEKIKAYKGLIIKVDNYNENLEDISLKIKQYKSNLGNVTLDDSRKNLVNLENQKNRFSVEITKLITELENLESNLSQKKVKKSEIQDQLKAETEDVLNSYKDRLNDLLQNKFGLNFKIVNPQTSFAGRKTNTNYYLEIDGERIPLGSSKTDDKPSFKTTLSEGEKNSLAFAFFITQIEQLPEIDKSIIILDDPITSLDGERKECIRDEIVKIANKAKQIIVLSHDAFFLKMLEEKFKKPKTLCIIREDDTSVIREWDIKSAVISQYFKDYEKIRLFIEKGETAVSIPEVARAIRPVIEANLRMRYPEDFLQKEWLGDFIKKVTISGTNSNLSEIKKKIDELHAINDFSKKFHHDTEASPEANLSNLKEETLTTFSKRTLKFLHNL